MLRRLFDAALPRRAPPGASPGPHWGLRAVAIVHRTHLLERRPGYDAGPACAALDAELLEIAPGAGARAVAAAVNGAGVDLLVDLWGWAPAGRAAGTLEVLSLRPAAASVLLLGTLEGGGGLADWTVRSARAHGPGLVARARPTYAACARQRPAPAQRTQPRTRIGPRSAPVQTGPSPRARPLGWSPVRPRARSRQLAAGRPPSSAAGTAMTAAAAAAAAGAG